jgi:hypothetical protein
LASASRLRFADGGGGGRSFFNADAKRLLGLGLTSSAHPSSSLPSSSLPSSSASFGHRLRLPRILLLLVVFLPLPNIFCWENYCIPPVLYCKKGNSILTSQNQFKFIGLKMFRYFEKLLFYVFSAIYLLALCPEMV